MEGINLDQCPCEARDVSTDCSISGTKSNISQNKVEKMAQKLMHKRPQKSLNRQAEEIN